MQLTNSTTSDSRPPALLRPPVVAIVLAVPIALGALMGGLPFRGALIDEYAYALPAFRLASAGVLRASPTAIAPAFLPIYFSAGTTWLFGQSLWAVRIWMPFALWGTGMLTFATSIKLGASRAWSLAVGLALVAGPVTLPMGGILMTDIPYSFFVALACLMALRWWKERSARSAAWVGIASAVSIPIRPLGIAIVLACLVAPAASRWRLKRNRPTPDAEPRTNPSLGVNEAVAMVGTALTGVAATFALLAMQGGATKSMDKYGTSALLPSLVNLAKMTFVFPAYAWLYLALFLLGPSLAMLFRFRWNGPIESGKTRAAGLFLMGLGPIVAVIAGAFGLTMPYMAWGSILARNGIGGGDRQNYSGLMWIVVTVVVACASAGLGWGLAQVRSTRDSDALNGDGSLGEESGRERLLVSLGVFQLIAAAPLGLALGDARVGYDRYLIPVVVCIAPIVAARSTKIKARVSTSNVVTCVLLVLTLVGIQDWIAQRNVAWSRLEQLVSSGVPLERIDGGFEWDTYHFGEKEAQPDRRQSSSWWLSEYAPSIDPEWALGLDEWEGYEVVEIVEWDSWTRSGRMYLMKRLDRGDGAS